MMAGGPATGEPRRIGNRPWGWDAAYGMLVMVALLASPPIVGIAAASISPTKQHRSTPVGSDLRTPIGGAGVSPSGAGAAASRFELDRIADPTYVAVHRLNAHSDHRWFADAAEVASGVSGFERSLNGPWKFHYATNPGQVVAGFEQPGRDCSGWDDIEVPGHLQLQGYDSPQYTNVQYPWDGREPVDPPQVPTRFNRSAVT